jgi:small multidrug resistance pump
MTWVMLAVAIAFEVAGTVALKFTAGFTRWLPTTIVVIGYGVSFTLLAQVVKTLPISLVYAVWSGVGTATVAAIGFTLLNEPVSVLKVVGVALVIAGVVALNLGGSH